jgi:hypothetical protein
LISHEKRRILKPTKVEKRGFGKVHLSESAFVSWVGFRYSLFWLWEYGHKKKNRDVPRFLGATSRFFACRRGFVGLAFGVDAAMDGKMLGVSAPAGAAGAGRRSWR